MMAELPSDVRARVSDLPEGVFAIVPMTEAHLPEVLAIERASFPSAWDEATFRTELGHDWSRCFVLVREGGAVIGNLIYWSIVGELELLNVATHPEHRGQGVGRALVAHMIDAGVRSGAHLATLEVRRSNAHAVALYERMGFATVAVRPGYYGDNGEDALVMQRVIPRDSHGNSPGTLKGPP